MKEILERTRGELTSRLRVSNNVTRSNDPTRKTSLSSLHDQLFRDPLGLTVSGRETLPRSLDVVGFGKSSSSSLDELLGESNEVLGLDGGGRGDERERLGVMSGSEIDGGEGGEDVGRSKSTVVVDPVNLRGEERAKTRRKKVRREWRRRRVENDDEKIRERLTRAPL